MSESGQQYHLLDELAEEFADRFRRGERPSIEEYTDRYPELADDIRELFPAMVKVERVKEAREDVSEPPPSGSLPPMARLGDYRIIRQVGRGGMGVVYEAEQVSLGRHVALKVLSKQLLVDARTRQRFEREAKASARLHHTNIVPVFGVGDYEGLPYYVMQFIQGLGLDEVLEELKRLQPVANDGGGAPRSSDGELRFTQRDFTAAETARSLLTGRFLSAADDEATVPEVTVDGVSERAAGTAAAMVSTAPAPVVGRLSDSFSLSSSSVVGPVSGTGGPAGKKRSTYWQSVARIGVQVADALRHAHAQGVLHRDIKPSNLLLDTAGVVWVTDFGLAKADDQKNLTDTGDILGTLRYMAPEAFDGRSDARADVYSLGLTLYELLARRPAYDEKERTRLIKQVTTSEPTRLDRLNPDIPRDLVTIVQKAIERDPAHRYPNASELTADLQRFLDDEPIQARRQKEWERCLRWARRNPGVAAMGAVLTAVLLAVTVISLIVAGQMSRLAQEKARAARGALDAFHEAEKARRHEAEQRTLAEAARLQAGAQRERAEAGFATARKAVDESFTIISESRLLNVPGLQPLRLELLRSALTFYEGLLVERADDPALGAELLATRLRVGRILGDLGRTAEARAAFRAAVEGYEQAVRERPDDPTNRAGLGEALYLSAQGEDAAATLRRAVAIWRELIASDPDNPAYRKQLADADNMLAMCLSGPGADEETLDLLRNCVELRLGLAAERPDDPDALKGLAESFNNLMFRLPRTARRQMSSMIQQALAFAEAAARLRPEDLELSRAVAILRENLAAIHWSQGRKGDAIREARIAHARERRLALDNPNVREYQYQYVRFSGWLAYAARETGRADEARRVLREAEDSIDRLSTDGPEDLFTLADLRASLAMNTRPLSYMSLDEPDRLFLEGLKERAMAALERAVAAGWRGADRLKGQHWSAFVFATPAQVARLEAAARSGGAPATVPASIAPRGGPGVPARSDRARTNLGMIQQSAYVFATPAQVARLQPAARPVGASAPGPAVAARSDRGRANLAMIQHCLGLLQAGQGRPEQAAGSLRRALAPREAMVREHPEESRHVLDLAATYAALLETDRRAGARAVDPVIERKGLEAMERAVSLRPDDPDLRGQRARLLAALGRADDAAAELHEALALVPPPKVDFYWEPPVPCEGYEELVRDPAVLERIGRLRPDDVVLWITRADALARRGDWPGAAAAFRRLLALEPENHTYWYVASTVFPRAGDVEGYRWVCREMLNRFKATDNPNICLWTAESCIVLPDASADYAGPAELAAKALAANASGYWSVVTVAAVDYRAGRFEAAADRLRSLREMASSTDRPPILTGRLILAMACRRLGRTDEARRELSSASEEITRTLGAGREIPPFGYWHDWLRVRLLRREAEALILDPDFPADPFAR